MNEFKLQSDETKEIAQALAKAQSQLENALKDSRNPHFNSQFASLAAIINATRGPLAANNLSVVQSTIPMGSELMLVTTLAHSSGQWFRSYTPVISTKKDAQGMGSGITYARRYSLAAIVGITQEDDDGNAAVTSGNINGSARPSSKPVVGTIQPADYIVNFGTVEKGYKGMTLKEAVERDGLPKVQLYINRLIENCAKERKIVPGSYAEMRDRLNEYARTLQDDAPIFEDDWDSAIDHLDRGEK